MFHPPSQGGGSDGNKPPSLWEWIASECQVRTTITGVAGTLFAVMGGLGLLIQHEVAVQQAALELRITQEQVKWPSPLIS